MFAIIGIFVVLGAVVGGYLLEGGNLHVIIQPIEVLIIFGAATGAFLISSPKKVVAQVAGSIGSVFKGHEMGKQGYLDVLLMMFELLNVARKDGLLAIESHVNNPDASPIFTKYPSVLANHAVKDFMCDNFKAFLAGNMNSHDLENLMDIDIEAHHHHAMIPSEAISKIADGMPALGIVAAVLGVVLTMGKISEPPEVLGHSIGAALVGTFLGVLTAYGFVGPISQNLAYIAKEHEIQLNVVKTAILACAMNWPPAMSVEAARRAISGSERPSFEELEEAIKAARQK